MGDGQGGRKSFVSLGPPIFATGLCHRPIWLSYYALYEARPFGSLHTTENQGSLLSLPGVPLSKPPSPLSLSLNHFSSVTRSPTSLEISKSQIRTGREDSRQRVQERKMLFILAGGPEFDPQTALQTSPQQPNSDSGTVEKIG